MLVLAGLITLKLNFLLILCKIKYRNVLFKNILRLTFRQIALLILMLTFLYIKVCLLEVILNISGLFQYPNQSNI